MSFLKSQGLVRFKKERKSKGCDKGKFIGNRYIFKIIGEIETREGKGRKDSLVP